MMKNNIRKVYIMDFHKEYSIIRDEIISLRRDIHKHPELSFEEYNTSSLICAVLDKYKISYKSKIAKTGICATLGVPGEKNLLIRADMDALPTEEKTEFEFSSVNKGVMHACGHDMHTASALATAIILKKHENELKGCVKIIFQPGEETTGGAMPMIEEGILESPKVTAAIGGHITPEFDNKIFKIKSGALMASPDDFSVKFIGKSTHGAEPQNGITPIIPASEFVIETQRLSKELCEGTPNVLSVCTVDSNGGVNTIPDEAIVLGTFRSFDESSRTKAKNALESLAEQIAKKHGVKLDYNYNFLYPPVINDENMTKFFINTAMNLYGDNSVILMDKPLMTGDDFSYFGKYVPSVYFWYGARGNKPSVLHSSDFNVNEDSIETCCAIFTAFTLSYLG